MIRLSLIICLVNALSIVAIGQSKINVKLADFCEKYDGEVKLSVFSLSDKYAQMNTNNKEVLISLSTDKRVNKNRCDKIIIIDIGSHSYFLPIDSTDHDIYEIELFSKKKGLFRECKKPLGIKVCKKRPSYVLKRIDGVNFSGHLKQIK